MSLKKLKQRMNREYLPFGDLIYDFTFNGWGTGELEIELEIQTIYDEIELSDLVKEIILNKVKLDKKRFEFSIYDGEGKLIYDIYKGGFYFVYTISYNNDEPYSMNQIILSFKETEFDAFKLVINCFDNFYLDFYLNGIKITNTIDTAYARIMIKEFLSAIPSNISFGDYNYYTCKKDKFSFCEGQMTITADITIYTFEKEDDSTFIYL